MKKLLFLISAAVAGVSVFADNWIYTETDAKNHKGTVTDGTWIFNATVKNGNMTVGVVICDSADCPLPSETTALDFSKPVSDGEGNDYAITVVSPEFCAPSYPYGKTTAADLVGKVSLPGEGLTKIGACAFMKCKNAACDFEVPSTLVEIGSRAFNEFGQLTISGELFPATLTTIGDYALKGAVIVAGASTDLDLTHLKRLPVGALQGVNLTSVKFGADLTELSANYEAGCLQDCTSLTNVTFHPDARFKMTMGWVFKNCTALKELDLSGLTATTPQLNMEQKSNYSFFTDCGVTKLTLGANLTKVWKYTFYNAKKLAEIHYYGAPADFELPVLVGAASGKALYTYLHLDGCPESVTNDWKALAQNGVINTDTSTWSEDAVGSDVAASRFLLYYEPQQGGGGELGHWIYDDRGAEPVVSNGVWCFKAEKPSKSVSIGAHVAWPSVPTEIDFSKPITDRFGNKLSITEISPVFGYQTSDPANDMRGVRGYPAAAFVNKVIFPTNGLISIGNYAFAMCTNLTEVSPLLPDSVNVLGKAAFLKVPLSAGCGDVRLMGLSSVEYGYFFQSKGVTSVTFGPNLKKLTASWNNMAFQDCTSMTNLTFDPAMSGGYLVGSTYGPFAGCSKVKRLDLSGFSDLGASGVRFSDMAGVGEIVLGENLSALSSAALNGMSGLTNVVFKGLPPKTMAFPYCNGGYDSRNINTDGMATKRIATTVHRKNLRTMNESGKCWLDYAARGTVAHRGTTWAKAFIGTADEANRPLVTTEPDGLMMIVK